MKIITHSGKAHLDEITACAILIELFPDAEIIRTRDTTTHEGIYVDIGRVYDPNELRFDHHQGDIPLRYDGSPYAAAGLIWKHYGLLYLASVLPAYAEDVKILEFIAQQVDARLIKGIDDLDNRYTKVSGHIMTVDQVIYRLSDVTNNGDGPEFNKAMELIDTLLVSLVHEALKEWKDRELVDLAIEEMRIRGDKFIILPKYLTGWSRSASFTEAVFGIFEDTLAKDYKVVAIADPCKPPCLKLPFPASWAVDVKAAGIKGLVFCHKGLHLCACNSLEAALAVANAAICNYEKNYALKLG